MHWQADEHPNVYSCRSGMCSLMRLSAEIISYHGDQGRNLFTHVPIVELEVFPLRNLAVGSPLTFLAKLQLHRWCH